MIKNKKDLSLVFFLSISGITLAHNATIQQNWIDMQHKYHQLNKKLIEDGLLQLEQKYCHSYWREMKENLKSFILGPCHQNFVTNPVISANMVREWKAIGDYEVSYLKNCISPNTKMMVDQVKDTQFVSLGIDSKEFNCSATSMGHLFYAAKVIEQSADEEIQTIVEFGGGYGNLARIFKDMLPDSTIFMIDLPELLAIQYFFLKSVLPDTEVIMHSHIPTNFKKGAIHLLPVFGIENFAINADVFISTFALSESAEDIQNIVKEKRFYDAKICYIQGQLAGTTLNWVRPQVIHEAMRECYKTVFCHPSHVFVLNIPAYEIMGLN